MTAKKDYVLVEFKNGSAAFSYDISRGEHLFTALMGLEAMVCKETGLDSADVRDVIDEMRGKNEAKPVPQRDPKEV